MKNTEGTGYVNPAHSAQAAEAVKHGAFRLDYHFLHGGNGTGQAEFFYRQAGRTPAMLDVEPVYGGSGAPQGHGDASPRSEVSRGFRLPAEASSVPTIGDACAFTDRFRALGGRLYWVYFPRWYWQALGSPSLKPFTDRGLLLWSSDYGTGYTDSDSGRGWQPYGGMTPKIWQYTASMQFGGFANVDFSAFRGSKYAGKQDDASVDACLTEFRSLSLTGKLPDTSRVMPPPSGFRVTGTGPHSVKVTWGAPAGTLPWKVSRYQFTVQAGGMNVDGYKPSGRYRDNPGEYQFGGLPPGKTLTAMVRALDAPDETHASPWAKVIFETPAT